MSNIRTPKTVPSGAGMQTTSRLQQIRFGQIATDEEARTALRRARRMQAQAVASAFIAFARWLRGKPGSRAQRVSDSIREAGR